MSDLSTRRSAKEFKGWRGVGENLLVVALASLGPTPSFDEGGFGHGRRRAYAVDEVPVVRVIVHARRPQPVAGSPYPLAACRKLSMVSSKIASSSDMGRFYSLPR
jgi:hypothetical protein